MRATVLEISSTLSARARSLTRMMKPSPRGRNVCSRERFLLVGQIDYVTSSISKASVTRQKRAA